MKLIDYVIKATNKNLCLHCLPNVGMGDEKNEKNWLICRKEQFTVQVNENTAPCTIGDWERCPLKTIDG